MRAIIILIMLTTLACQKGREPEREEPLIAAIPEGCVQFMAPHNPEGYHEFGKDSGEVLWADAYTCGVREGKVCSYYRHNPDFTEGSFKQDTRCE